MTVSRLFNHLRAIIYHLRVAHTHTQTNNAVETHFHSAFVMWISRQKQVPASMMKLNQMSHAAALLLFLSSSVGTEYFCVFMADFEHFFTTLTYLHLHKKIKHRKKNAIFFVPKYRSVQSLSALCVKARHEYDFNHVRNIHHKVPCSWWSEGEGC